MQMTEADRGNIRRNAYFKWLDAGAPPSDGIDFWLAAESEYLYDVDDEEAEKMKQEAMGQQEPGEDAAAWVREGNPAMRKRSQPDKEALIGSRG